MGFAELGSVSPRWPSHEAILPGLKTVLPNGWLR
jgi:hypothetical protein